ncbi:putative glutathione synthetase [Clavispora lusitaniae]|uniref:Glutathione synthetase n=1 Tax=Clavispora lusitaniae TaxID=36911 RepID=A0AA91Q4W5_CLALS|nr:putative glutathione synthetase [Clavispora lusitaniae]
MKIGGNSILCHQFHIYKRTRIFFSVRLNLNAVCRLEKSFQFNLGNQTFADDVIVNCNSRYIYVELGIFGTVVFNEETGEISANDNAGHLRSKFCSSDEGGVAGLMSFE